MASAGPSVTGATAAIACSGASRSAPATLPLRTISGTPRGVRASAGSRALGVRHGAPVVDRGKRHARDHSTSAPWRNEDSPLRNVRSTTLVQRRSTLAEDDLALAAMASSPPAGSRHSARCASRAPTSAILPGSVPPPLMTSACAGRSDDGKISPGCSTNDTATIGTCRSIAIASS